MEIGVGVIVFIAMVALAIGLGLGYFLSRTLGGAQVRKVQVEAQRIEEEAEAKARSAILTAKDEAVKIRDDAQEEVSRWRTNLRREEERRVVLFREELAGPIRDLGVRPVTFRPVY